MKGTIKVLTMLVGEDGKDIGNIGELELPHVPQIGSHILAHDTPEAPANGIDQEHVYEVVDVRYQVRRAVAGGTRELFGWEIAVRHRGPHLAFRLPMAD
jgi:hypothetical protein